MAVDVSRSGGTALLNLVVLSYDPSLQTAAHAQHIATLAEAKKIKVEIKDSDGKLISSHEQCLRVEMAQGSRPIRLRLHMPNDTKREFPPTSRVGRPIPETVVFERYLEPAGRDRAASREKFRIRHRIDLNANSIFPLARDRERESRGLYSQAFPLSGGLEVNLKNASSVEQAIRSLCEPFGQVESIVPADESHSDEGFIVRFFDRDVTLRAQQQLPLLMGVSCFRVMPTQPLKDAMYSSIPGKLLHAAAPEVLPEPVVSTTPAFADAVRGSVRSLPKTQRDDWPALPTLKPTVKKELPTLPISPELEKDFLTEGPQDFGSRLPGILSPVSEEHSLDDPNDDLGSRIDEEPLGPTAPGISEAVVESSLPSTTSVMHPEGKANRETSVLGLVDVPPLRPTNQLNHPVVIPTHTSHTRQSPVVHLGSLPQTGRQSRSGIERMTVLVRQLPLDTSPEALRERFKSYGRLVSILWYSDLEFLRRSQALADGYSATSDVQRLRSRGYGILHVYGVRSTCCDPRGSL